MCGQAAELLAEHFTVYKLEQNSAAQLIGTYRHAFV